MQWNLALSAARSTGFIVEDFPRAADDAAQLGDAGLLPDAALVLEMDDADAVARLLPARLARWRSRRDQVLERRRAARDRRRRRREAAIDRRRAKLARDAEKRKAEREVSRVTSRYSDDSNRSHRRRRPIPTWR